MYLLFVYWKAIVTNNETSKVRTLSSSIPSYIAITNYFSDQKQFTWSTPNEVACAMKKRQIEMLSNCARDTHLELSKRPILSQTTPGSKKLLDYDMM